MNDLLRLTQESVYNHGSVDQYDIVRESRHRYFVNTKVGPSIPILHEEVEKFIETNGVCSEASSIRLQYDFKVLIKLLQLLILYI